MGIDFSAHLEIKLVALIAEVFGLHMTHMAVRALQVLAVVRRNVRVGGLDLCGLFHKRVLLMARRAGFDGGRLRILHILTMAHLAAQTFRLVAISKEVVGSARRKRSGKKRTKRSK